MRTANFKNITSANAGTKVVVIDNYNGQVEAILRAVTINGTSAKGITIYDGRLIKDNTGAYTDNFEPGQATIAKIGDNVPETTLDYCVSARYGIVLDIDAGFDGDFTILFN